jgi:hypothetical protein
MREYLFELVRSSPTPAMGYNVAREYLQARILAALQRAGAMVPLAFHGGTALRLLYASPRYSEDLDFALEQARSQYDLRDYLQAIHRGLSAEGYTLNIRLNDHRVVHSAFVRFVGLPYDLGLSPHRDQVLAVKIEVDTNPPTGAGLSTTVIRRYVTLQLQHHDRASLLAGKLHAVLQRSFLKGRDVYDLLWYLSDPEWPAPNIALLNNALQQTGWAGERLTQDDWRSPVRERLEGANWDQVVTDVRPFLDPNADLGLLTLKNLMQVLG